MIEDERQINIINCPECGNILPNRIISDITQNKSRVYCEYCGVLISHQKDSTDSVSLEQSDSKFSLDTSDITNVLKNYIYRRIYLLLNNNEVIYKKIKGNLPLKKANIHLLVNRLRKDLLKLKIPEVELKKVSLTSQTRLKDYICQLKTSLKSAKPLRKTDFTMMAEAIELVFNLLQGRFEFQTLPKHERKVILDLKQYFGFKIKLIPNDSFEYFLSQKLCILIYTYLRQQQYISPQTEVEAAPPPLQIDDITAQLIDFSKAAQITDLLSKNISAVNKQKISHSLNQLQKELSFDWIYCQAFQDHIYHLITVIHGLIHQKERWDSLVEQELMISKCLMESAVFERDPEFSAPFKLNLTIVLSRIIFAMFNAALANVRPNLHPKEITAPMGNEIVQKILSELSEGKKITVPFLNKFYNLSLEEFTTEYIILLRKFSSDLIFMNSFKEFLKHLTKIVYKITHTISKKSKLLKTEQAIIADLANFTINKHLSSYFYTDHREVIKDVKFQDIFTKDIADNDPLWRVRAYIIGFLLADGTIRFNPYELSATQNKKDKDIIINLNKALGGKISGPDDKNKYWLNVYGKELVQKLKEFGMVKAHSKKEIAELLSPPEFITRIINNQSLLKDFIRGFYDGDGWITGSFKRGDTSFRILGPIKFLESLKTMIEKEINGISMFITAERKQYYVIGNKKYQIFSKLKIYKKGYGYYKLTTEDLKKGEIKVYEHPWLKLLITGGNYNCIRFFNWLYDNDDNFESFELSNIKLCGERKFQKAIKILGNNQQRREKLAPSWKDFIFDVISSLESRFFTAKEIKERIDAKLMDELESLKLKKLFEARRVPSLDKLHERLKYFEFLERQISHFRKGKVKYYYNITNNNLEVPEADNRSIELIDSKGIKKNIKNYIIYILLREDRSLNFREIEEYLNKSSMFSKGTLFLKNIRLNIAELIAFDILINLTKNEDIEKQNYILNYSKLKELYQMNTNDLELNFKKKFLNKK